jgi:hypothetical protein
MLSATEADELRKLYYDITTDNDRWPGTSLLHFEGLLSILDSLVSIVSDRKGLDTIFLDWLNYAERRGGKWCSSELEGFRQLREFIQVSPELMVMFRAVSEISPNPHRTSTN